MKTILKLNDLLNLSDEDLSVTKIRLNTNNGKNNPIDIFKSNPRELLDWNYWNNKTYKVGQISIGLVNMGDDKWLLFTVGKIVKMRNFPIDGQGLRSVDGKGVEVEYETIEDYNDLYGRVIIRYHNDSQNMFRNARPLIDELVISAILPSVYSGFEFPGYDKVCLSYNELKTIVQGNFPTYKAALENQKAVYLLSDKSNGKLYVGSATAKYGMLLARWRAYVDNGHGGNECLKELVREKGFDYIKQNFQYTIIENFNSKVDDDYVLSRESYWKKVLLTRTFGYNKN